MKYLIELNNNPLRIDYSVFKKKKKKKNPIIRASQAASSPFQKESLPRLSTLSIKNKRNEQEKGAKIMSPAAASFQLYFRMQPKK
jgi:hypothetical protein